MKDWNSITVDRYYENINVDNKVGIGILDISRDIPNKFLQKRSFDMTYFYINRMIKMGMCSYVGFHKTVKEILELLNPIITNYVESNSIIMVLPKKNIIVGKKNLDISDQIINLLNYKIIKINF